VRAKLGPGRPSGRYRVRRAQRHGVGGGRSRGLVVVLAPRRAHGQPVLRGGGAHVGEGQHLLARPAQPARGAQTVPAPRLVALPPTAANRRRSNSRRGPRDSRGRDRRGGRPVPLPASAVAGLHALAPCGGSARGWSTTTAWCAQPRGAPRPDESRAESATMPAGPCGGTEGFTTTNNSTSLDLEDNKGSPDTENTSDWRCFSRRSQVNLLLITLPVFIMSY
jgi:hypothetical protein